MLAPGRYWDDAASISPVPALYWHITVLLTVSNPCCAESEAELKFANKMAAFFWNEKQTDFLSVVSMKIN